MAGADAVATPGAIATSGATSAGLAGDSRSLPADIPVRRERSEAVGAAGNVAWTAWSVIALLALVSTVLVLGRRARKAGRTGFPATGLSWRGMMRGHAEAAPSVLGSVRLTSQHSLHVVSWNGTELLLGCSHRGVDVLTQRPQGSTALAAQGEAS